MRTKKRKILWMMFFAFAFCAAFQSHCIKAEAKVVKRDVTPREPSSSDLQVVRKVTKLASKRWIQSYTDDKALLWESADYQGEIQRTGSLYERSYGFKKIWTCNESRLFYGEWKNLVMDRQ